MTAALHHFPTPANFVARMAAQDEAVALSRTILRGKERHAPDDLRLACHTLMTYGDSFDWMDGYHVLRAMDAPKPAPTIHARPGFLRGELATVLGLGMIVAVCVAMLKVGV